MNQSRELHSTIICLQADKLLLVRKESTEWSLPGGRIDPGETQIEAARRELKEGTGLALSEAQFLGHHVLEEEEHWLQRIAVPPAMEPHPSHGKAECLWISIHELNQIQVKPTDIELLRREGIITMRG
ncbi:NUDIX domain-containing protein [Pseudomonas putida]|uniref:NUDIX domain-containing protein n=1 Tax=Pseudomonas putida TaxID=303 RepID=UPI0023637E56|nr:NUDIX domain-containing protein [Pseudomonas putida]MDD2067754.1 NUDIX domain-containing protein [Pseudomonas putida]HDS1738358.1 NUDIX domain-containing protein [Pseudomonas putida]